EVRYIAAAFPSACGKTNLAMMQPTLPGWKVETVGDDICWMRPGKDGRLYAVNPEAGFFGVAPGTSRKTNANAMAAMAKNAIFTNVALTPDGDVWWEGIGSPPPAGLIDWKGQVWSPKAGTTASHPNARFTAPAGQCPSIAPEWEDPKGVPISAILFGGRRSDTVPLVVEAFDWRHGVFLASNISSEGTAAAENKVGAIRRDPFAMLPFCGYNMGDYFAHWLEVGAGLDPKRRPRIYYVNWFLKDGEGRLLWPGFGENARVLEWIFERLAGRVAAIETAIGALPAPACLDVEGLDLSAEEIASLLEVDPSAWLDEARRIAEGYQKFGERLPAALREELDGLLERLAAEDSPRFAQGSAPRLAAGGAG
ncbi:MAG: phosphoenolpyruvate carboxykinase (GTP), partial [Caulobacteraceae bacterium]